MVWIFGGALDPFGTGGGDVLDVPWSRARIGICRRCGIFRRLFWVAASLGIFYLFRAPSAPGVVDQRRLCHRDVHAADRRSPWACWVDLAWGATSELTLCAVGPILDCDDPAPLPPSLSRFLILAEAPSGAGDGVPRGAVQDNWIDFDFCGRQIVCCRRGNGRCLEGQQ